MSGGGSQGMYGNQSSTAFGGQGTGSQVPFGQGYTGNQFNGAYNAITGNPGMPPAGSNTGANYSMPMDNSSMPGSGMGANYPMPGSDPGGSGYFPMADSSNWMQMLMQGQQQQPPAAPQPPQQPPNLATQEDYNRYNNLTPSVTPPPQMTYQNGVATGFANQGTAQSQPMDPNPLARGANPLAAQNPLGVPKGMATFPGGDLYRTWLYGPTAGAFGGVSRPNNVPINYGYFPDTQTWGLQPSGPIGR